MGNNTIVKKSIVILFLFSISMFAQGETALPFMTMPNSVISYGAGNIGTSLLFKDVMGAHYNPASIGYLARESNFGYQIVTTPIKWIPSLGADIKMINYGVAAGFNFKAKFNIPISIGISMQRQQVDYGTYKTERSYDFSNNYSIGIAWDWLIDIYAGISFKNSVSQVMDSFARTYQATPKFKDYGIILNIPIDELAFYNKKIELGNNSFITPNFDLSIGYSYLNVGDNVYYLDVIQEAPGPRTARLGYTIEFGTNIAFDNTKLGFINYSFTAEADDILAKSVDYNSTNSQIEFDGMFGKIIPAKNLISLKSDDNTVVHKGHIIKLFDSIYLLSGRFQGGGWSTSIKSNGVGFSSNGLGKLLISLTTNNIIKYIFSHFELQYYKSTTFADDIRQTNSEGIYFYINNITL